MGVFQTLAVLAGLSLVVPLAGAEPNPKDYLIDYGAAAMKQHVCEDCPGYIAQMIEVAPQRLGDLHDKSDIKVGDCHATLVGPDLMLTASHCMRNWHGPDRWSAKAAGDCSKVYAFYFPATARLPFEEVRCRAIVSPIATSSGAPQLAPDDVLVQLAREVQRPAAQVDTAPIVGGERLDNWHYDGDRKTFVHTSCRHVEGSVLSPLHDAGEGAYATLSCDGPVTPGCSGGGVFDNGRLRAVISCGSAGSAFGTSLFGPDEVVVSQMSCATTAGVPAAARCFTTPARMQQAMYDLYLGAIDKTGVWIEGTRRLLEERLPYAELAFTHGPQTLPPFSYTPGYVVTCYHRDRLPPEGRVMTGVLFDLTTFRPRYVMFNTDTTIRGVAMRSAGDMEEFNIGLAVQWMDRPSADVPDCREATAAPE